MKRIMFAFSLVLCLSICACCSAGVTNQAQNVNPPAAATIGSSTQPDLWDFGDVDAAVVLEHDFVLLNNSAIDLTIKDTTTSCGCTVSEIKKKLLKPGESTTLSIKLDTKGYTGDVQQFVYVNTDSMDKPIMRFTVKAKVLPQS